MMPAVSVGSTLRVWKASHLRQNQNDEGIIKKAGIRKHQRLSKKKKRGRGFEYGLSRPAYNVAISQLPGLKTVYPCKKTITNVEKRAYQAALGAL